MYRIYLVIQFPLNPLFMYQQWRFIDTLTFYLFIIYSSAYKTEKYIHPHLAQKTSSV